MVKYIDKEVKLFCCKVFKYFASIENGETMPLKPGETKRQLAARLSKLSGFSII